MLQSLVLNETSSTPAVEFDASKGTLKILGLALSENTMRFFEPLWAWVDEYVHNPSTQTTVYLQLVAFNTSFAKCLLGFLRKLQPISDQVIVFWYCDQYDEDMKETCQDFQDLLKLDIKLIIEESE